MSVEVKNAATVKEMFEHIAARTGEDRGDVFLDILVDIIFHKGDKDIWFQQQSLNRIAEIYGTVAPTLLTKSGREEDVPF